MNNSCQNETLASHIRPSHHPHQQINGWNLKKISELLYNSFVTIGIHGRKDIMPENTIPKGVEKGSLEHMMFITLTISIDYQRDALSLWGSSRKTFGDPDTKYLFDPQSLNETSVEKVVKDMQKYKLSRKVKKDADIWRTIGLSIYEKWGGDPFNFLQDCRWDALTILERLKNDTHLYNGRQISDYPYLRGEKIGPLWLRVLRDNLDISHIKNLDKVPIPVDIHIARATLALGVVKGHIKCRLNDLFECIREAWFGGVKGLNANNRPMIALDLDKPLWYLSKYGCKKRDKTSGYCPVSYDCVMKEFCIKGKIIIENRVVDLET